MPIVLKSGGLNLLEPSGPVQACNGVALTLTLCSFSLLGCEDLKSRNRIFALGIPKYPLTRRVLQISRLVANGKQKQCSHPGHENDISDAALCVVRLG